MATFALVPVVALADELPPPHVATSTDTDGCAMCHRAHTSASSVSSRDQLGTSINALIVGDSGTAGEGDTSLCFTCHGIEALGASVDVQTDFEKTSYHRSAPETSSFGPSPKQCSDCHDSHGSSRTASDTPYSALLRSFDPSGSPVYMGDAYCATCHDGRSGDLWDDLGVWEKTAHASIVPTTTGTEISCTACHAPHGSDNTALVVESLAPPSAPDTVSVPANDRWLCYGCHPGTSATYAGGVTYEGSIHGSSAATVPISAEWVGRMPAGSSETSRPAGECQNCHASMGRNDGEGNPIDKLAKAEGADLCYTCHRSGSTVATDMASLATVPATNVAEVVVGLGSASSTAQFGRVQVFSRRSPDQSALDAPREFLRGRYGPVALGDYDGDGTTELLAATSDAATVTALAASPLGGMDPDLGEMALWAPAEHLLVADVLGGDDRPEVVTADGTNVRFYRWNLSALTYLGSVTVTGTVTGMAAGDVLGTDRAEIAVTTTGNERLEVISATTGSFEVARSIATRSGPVGPSIGDLDGDGRGEIAVANSAEPTYTASVYTGLGAEAAVVSQVSSSARAVSTTIGDALTAVSPSGTSGAELIVVRDVPALADPDSWVDVFPQLAGGGGFAAVETRSVGGGANPTQAVVTDVDDDDMPEVAIALAGTWAGAATPVAPGLGVIEVVSGSGLGGLTLSMTAGTESAADGAARAWIASGDLGAVPLSAHASSSVAGAHVSTETAGFARHVECVDCHNVHEATSTVEPAPAALGAEAGAWGVSVENAPAGSITYASKPGVDYEYELCLKCHGRWASAGRTRDIASEVDTRNASTHAVEGVSTACEATDGSFVSSTTTWTAGSILRCTDCHGNADVTQPAGPHLSTSAPLLKSPYVGVTPSDASMLCYDCHRPEVYYSGTIDGEPESTSRFNDGRKLHRTHVGVNGLGCGTCHASHGSTANRHLVRSDLGFNHSGSGGSCTNGCHTGGVSYSRP